MEEISSSREGCWQSFGSSRTVKYCVREASDGGLVGGGGDKDASSGLRVD